MSLVRLADEEPKIFLVDRLNKPTESKEISLKELAEETQYSMRIFVGKGRQKSFVDYFGQAKENISKILAREDFTKVYVCEFRGGKK